jgi:hypothetical protein
MRQTTELVKSTILEKRSFLVDCFSAPSSRSGSATFGLRASFRTPGAIRDSGGSGAHRSKAPLRIVAIASLGER